jgi:ER-bound oxygenase mpaB/B'/Rubber oxygenase, catalytic domain
MNAPTGHDPLEIVSRESLECELNLVRGAAAGSLLGIFGPRSITWQVNREAAIFLGAGRALLLQLAHPWVAAAVEQHSDTFAHPIGRFHRTFSTVFTMVFGTLDQSLAAARHLQRRHAAIRGTLKSPAGPFPAGSCYCANEVSALRWVHATLIETALMGHALVLPALTKEQRELYYAKSRLFAGLVRDPEAMPLAGLDGVFRLYRSDDTIQHVNCYRPSASHGAPPPRRCGHLAAHPSLVQGLDGSAASSAATRRVCTSPWRGGAGRCSAACRARSADLSPFTLSAPIRWTLPGGRTTACGDDATGLCRADVQPILDGSVRPRSVSGLTGALTPNDVNSTGGRTAPRKCFGQRP